MREGNVLFFKIFGMLEIFFNTKTLSDAFYLVDL